LGNDCCHIYLLPQPNTFKKLKDELEIALPNPLAHVALGALEQLPYSTAVIKEGLRLSLGLLADFPESWSIKPSSFRVGKFQREFQ
jgi:hypothetical protein